MTRDSPTPYYPVINFILHDLNMTVKDFSVEMGIPNSTISTWANRHKSISELPYYLFDALAQKSGLSIEKVFRRLVFFEREYGSYVRKSTQGTKAAILSYNTLDNVRRKISEIGIPEANVVNLANKLMATRTKPVQFRGYLMEFYIKWNIDYPEELKEAAENGNLFRKFMLYFAQDLAIHVNEMKADRLGLGQGIFKGIISRHQ